MSVVLVMLAAVLVAAISVVVTMIRDNYPDARTSARDRLILRNPMLNGDPNIRWSARSRRVRIGRLASLAIAVALLVASDRPAAADALVRR